MKNKTIKTFPELFSKTSLGKVTSIKLSVEECSDKTCDIVNKHGFVGGAIQEDRRKIKAGKNIGKANETSIAEQAVSEAASKWQKKIDENYTTNKSGIPDNPIVLPMLAHKFKERKHKIVFPCFAQPKFNGLRNLASFTKKEVVNTSRGGKPYTAVKHIAEMAFSISPILKEFRLDGELYKHGFTLQEINRRVKKYRKDLTEEIDYWIYDLAVDNIDFEDRYKILQDFFKKINAKHGTDCSLKLCPTVECKDEAEVKVLHDKFVNDGFEGVILRNKKGFYEFDNRSINLQKYKEFEDDEFKICGFKEGTGRETGAIIFICEVKDPVSGGPTEFEVRPRGTIEQRKEDFKIAKTFIGKMYTVRYFELSEKNVPSGNTVGIGVREEGD